MAIAENEVFRYATLLDEAVMTRKEVRRLTATDPSIAVEDGYRIQTAGIRLREARGESIVGYKMGLTSKAKMQQMGVSSPIAGVLTSAMRIPDGGVIELRDRIHPKVEPEIAFITRIDMGGELTRETFLAGCETVMPALEIIDSRFVNFDFTLADVLADNCSSSGFVLGGSPMNPRDVAAKLDAFPMKLSINGKLLQTGVSGAIYGHPVDSCLALVKLLAKWGRSLPRGSVVLAGGATAAESIKTGDKIELEVPGLGTVAASVR